MKKSDAVIARIVGELDDEQAAYQKLHRKYHEKDDEEAKRIHRMMVVLCQRIQKELLKAGA
jgi:hypothetical protein